MIESLLIIIVGELFVALILLYSILSICIKILELVEPIPQTGHVSGRLIYPDLTLISDVTVILINSIGDTVFSTVSDVDGKFAFTENVAIGIYTLHAHKDLPVGFIEGSAEIEILGGDEISVDLPLVKSFDNYGQGFHLRTDK